MFHRTSDLAGTVAGAPCHKCFGKTRCGDLTGNPSAWEARGEDRKFETSLSFIARPHRETKPESFEREWVREDGPEGEAGRMAQRVRQGGWPRGWGRKDSPEGGAGRMAQKKSQNQTLPTL